MRFTMSINNKDTTKGGHAQKKSNMVPSLFLLDLFVLNLSFVKDFTVSMIRHSHRPDGKLSVTVSPGDSALAVQFLLAHRTVNISKLRETSIKEKSQFLFICEFSSWILLCCLNVSLNIAYQVKIFLVNCCHFFSYGSFPCLKSINRR